MKEYECVQLNHHRDIGPEIERYQKNGWRLHTYQAAGVQTGCSHYLLFEREKATQ